MERSGQEEYDFLASLVRLLGARRVLEVGTSAGGGALALARAVAAARPSARLDTARPEIVTIDIEDRRESACREHSGPVPIRFIQGDSGEVLERMARRGERFGLVFIDGGHHHATVRRDWELASLMTDAVVLHDALQFAGVDRVVRAIRRDAAWDVAVLSYPGTTLVDAAAGQAGFCPRCPGLALATRRRAVDVGDREGAVAPERPTRRSRQAFSRRAARFGAWHGEAGRSGDLTLHDWEILFHFLWNLAPGSIAHLGHAGTGASLLFLEYARAKRAEVTLADPSGRFWDARQPLLPAALQGQARAARILTGPEAGDLAPLRRGSALYWLDEHADSRAYAIGRKLARGLRSGASSSVEDPYNAGDVLCVRNCSPDHGQPGAQRFFGALCTCEAAWPFLRWLESQPLDGRTVRARLASPRATFGDYVNAGHRLVVWVEEQS